MPRNKGKKIKDKLSDVFDITIKESADAPKPVGRLRKYSIVDVIAQIKHTQEYIKDGRYVTCEEEDEPLIERSRDVSVSREDHDDDDSDVLN